MIDILPYIQALQGPILITGASGFVGANLFRTISAIRKDVYAVVQRNRNWRLVDVPDEQLVSTDLNDLNMVKNMVDRIRPKTVFDCVAYGAYSFEKNVELIYETNFIGIVKLVELLSEGSVAAYIHAGSSSEYGSNSAGPREDAICEPNSHYAVSKVSAEQYLKFAGKTRAFPCVNLRLYSVYGPLEDVSRLMPAMVRAALNGKLPPLVNPDISRDFVYVDDVCAAFIIAAAKMNPDMFGESINIGSGKKTSIAELVETVQRLFSLKVQPEYNSMERRDWDLEEWYSNSDKARSMIGWSAETSLEVGIRQLANWVEQLGELDLGNYTKLSNQKPRRSISAIVACYKDAQAIPFMHQRLTETFRRLEIDYELIFVNDCSPDNSSEVIRDISAMDPHVLGITHSRNFGSQMAFRSGMELSTKQAVVLLDGDLQDPPELIAQFYPLWEKGYDVVYGRRVKREMPWIWGMLYKAFYRVFAAFSYVEVPLDAGDFSLIDRRVVRWILASGERDLFMRGLRAYMGFKQTGVDYVRPDRLFGVTTNSLVKNIGWAKKGILSFSNVPLAVLVTIGAVLFVVSFITALATILLRLVHPELAPRGLTTVLITILFFGSVNLVAIGIVGEYVGKIMLEVKGRPRLIRAATIRNGISTDLTGPAGD
jgi:nucleoside-diphosphate-sugar epimerase/glycosyltransferase involved in cell wall biosynthesis